MLISLLLLQAAVSQDRGTPANSNEVVVTAQRNPDLLTPCLARKCPPEEEVEAALSTAVEQFRTGKYGDARSVLARTIGRNKKYAARMPGKISDLYATYADVSSHYGDTAGYRTGTWESVDVLRKHLGKSHPATLALRPFVGDMLALSGQPTAADDLYRDAARDAAAAGQTRLAALIVIRRTHLALSAGRLKMAEKLLTEVPSDQVADPRIASLISTIRIRIAMARKDDALVDRLLAGWRSTSGEAPTLVYGPPMPILDPVSAADVVQMGAVRRSVDEFLWVDVGFWVLPSGITAQAEILRPADAKEWAKPLIAQVARRRYMPLSGGPGSPGSYRIERYSLRQDLGLVTGSRMVGRAGPLKFIQVDMSSPPPAAPAP